VFRYCSWLISKSIHGESNNVGDQVPTNQLFTQSEVANYLCVSIEEVQKLTEMPNGPGSYISEIPHIKIKDKVYYPKTAIDRWLLKLELTVVN